MATVRIPELDELPEDARRRVELMKQWFHIEFAPKMTRALAFVPEFQAHHGFCSKRAMSDGALTRGQKEIIATAVSAVNACDY